jgi:hypothetical protein
VRQACENYQCDQGARELRARRWCLALPWFNEPLTSAALGDVRVLSGMRRAHTQLHRVIVHASLMAARCAFDCTLAFVVRVRVEHRHTSKA